MSRRDDLISLAYLLAYLLHGGRLPGIDLEAKMNQVQSYNSILAAKMRMNPRHLCGKHVSDDLFRFFNEIFSMGYD